MQSEPPLGILDRLKTKPSNSPHPDQGRDPYRGVILLLLLATLLGTLFVAVGGSILGNPVLVDVAVTLALATGILNGVAVAQAIRSRPPKTVEEVSAPRTAVEPEAAPLAGTPLTREVIRVSQRLADYRTWISHWFKDLRMSAIARYTAGVGMIGIIIGLTSTAQEIALSPLIAGIAAAICLGAAGLAAMVARYFNDVDLSRLPEGPWLCRGSRVMAWIFVLSAASMGLEWAGLNKILLTLHFVVLLFDALVCYGLLTTKISEADSVIIFPMDLAVLSILGSRTNILASILDSAERQLGIDLRSTWAFALVRRSLEPLLVCLCVVGWLSTSLTIVGVSEQGLVERFGKPVGGQPLAPGIHLHWPWPVDHIFRVPVQRVQTIQVGHEGEEKEGPEDVLWSVEHAPNEYTLVLGNGRDLITVDAAVQYRISDARAWRYHYQNPAEALRAIAYRAVMRSTVNRTLSDALSQNVATLTSQMRTMVQQDADALGLGVEIEGFTVGGMHPPVPVAPSYEAVVSAEIDKVTLIIGARTYSNRTVPAATAAALVTENGARAEEATGLAQATGEAWSFQTIESQYRASPKEYIFRRRLETLEERLADKRFTVVDSRIQRDGGELWIMQ